MQEITFKNKSMTINYDLDEIKRKINQFILKTSYLTDEQVNDDTLIFVQGIMDSMGFISLITFLDEAFSIKATDSDLIESNFESINAIAEFVVRKLNQN